MPIEAMRARVPAPPRRAVISSVWLPLWQLARVGDDRRADMAGHHHRAFDVRGVDAQVGDQRLGKALHRELGGGIGGLRDVGRDEGPEAVHARRIDDMAGIGAAQQRHEGPGAEIDAAPADVERALPFIALVDEEVAAAADAGIVEQEMDAVAVAVAWPPRRESAATCGSSATSAICVVMRWPWRRPLGLAEPLGLGHGAGRTSPSAMLQPSAASWRANSRPMPVPPPVMTAILPAKSFMPVPRFFIKRDESASGQGSPAG